MPFFFFCCHTSPIHLGSFLNANHYHLQLLLSSSDPAMLRDHVITRIYALIRAKALERLMRPFLELLFYTRGDLFIDNAYHLTLELLLKVNTNLE